MAKTTIHKMVKGITGEQLCLCPSKGRKVLSYSWAKVNCERCHTYKGMKFNPRQMKEIKRLRQDG